MSLGSLTLMKAANPFPENSTHVKVSIRFQGTQKPAEAHGFQAQNHLVEMVH